MYRSRRQPNPSSSDNLQYFRQCFLSALDKLNDSATKQLGLEEVHSILSEQAQTSEHISIVLNLLSENDDHHKVGARRETLKVLGIVAEVFKGKTLEFLPKILSLLAKKLKENNPQIHESLSDAIGSVIGFGVQSLPTREACRHINTTLRNLYVLCESSNRYTQTGAALCVSKVIQCSPVDCLYILADELMEKLVDLLRTPGCKAHLQLLECILSLILGIEDNPNKLKENSKAIFSVIIDNLANADWNVRKIAVEIVYTLSVLIKEVIALRKHELLTALNHCRFDKIRNVRDIASTTINLLKDIPDPPTLDTEESSVASFRQNQLYGTAPYKDKYSNSLSQQHGKSEPVIKNNWERLQRPVGELENNDHKRSEDISQQKYPSSTKARSGVDTNPKFFNNATSKGSIPDSGVFTKNPYDLQPQSEPSRHEYNKPEARTHNAGDLNTYPSSSKRRDSSQPLITQTNPMVTDFTDNGEAKGGLRSSSANKKPITSEAALQAHKRKLSEQEAHVLSNKLGSQKPKIDPSLAKEEAQLSRNKQPYGQSFKDLTTIQTIETPNRTEPQSGTKAQIPDSASIGSPAGFFADDFAGLHRQLKKISKQQSQLIESVSAFQVSTQSEIGNLKSRMGYLEDFVQKIYLSQKEQPAYQNPPQHSPYSSMNQGFGLNASPYNPTYSHQQNQSNLRETYSQNLPHSQSVNFQPYGMRQSYQSNPYSLHDEYNFTSPGQTGKHQQSYKEGLPEFNSIRFETEKRDTHNSKQGRSSDPRQQETSYPKQRGDNMSQHDGNGLGGGDSHNETYSNKSRKSSTWIKVEELLKKGHIGEAYAVCVNQEDDDLMVRLMEKTGVVVNKLSELVVEEVIGLVEKRLLERRDRELVIDWVETAVQTKSLTSVERLIKLNEIFGQMLGERGLTSEEHQRIAKIKDHIGARLAVGDMSIREGQDEIEIPDHIRN